MVNVASMVVLVMVPRAAVTPPVTVTVVVAVKFVPVMTTGTDVPR